MADPPPISPGPPGGDRNTSLRAKVIDEVVSTEKTFVASLKLVIESYVRPLKDQNIITKEDLSGLFSNWEMLLMHDGDDAVPTQYPLNNAFLEDLEKATARGTSECRIGAPFKDFAPYFRMFSTYLGSYEKAMALKEELCEKNRRFAMFIEEVRKDPKCQGLDLMSYLIMPVQRIPRYKLLLESLIKYTDPSHGDYQDLHKALTLVSAAASHNNDAIKKQQEAAKMMEIQNLFDTHGVVAVPSLMDSPIRRFMREGVLNVKRAKEGKIKRLNVWLFNDLILLGRPPDLIFSSDKYILKAYLELEDCTVSHDMDPANGIEDRDKAFVLSKPSCDPWILWAKDGAEMDTWLKDVAAAIEEAKKMVGRKAATKTTPAVTPVASPSQSSTSTVLSASTSKSSVFLRSFNNLPIATVVGDQYKQQQPVTAVVLPPPPPLPTRDTTATSDVGATTTITIATTSTTTLRPTKDITTSMPETNSATTASATSNVSGGFTSFFTKARRQSITSEPPSLNTTATVPPAPSRDASTAVTTATIKKMRDVVAGHEAEVADRIALLARLRGLALLRIVMGTDARGRRIDDGLYHLEQQELAIKKRQQQQLQQEKETLASSPHKSEVEQLAEALHFTLERDALALDCLVELLILLVTHGVTADRRNAKEILELRSVISDLAILKAKSMDLEPPPSSSTATNVTSKATADSSPNAVANPSTNRPLSISKGTKADTSSRPTPREPMTAAPAVPDKPAKPRPLSGGQHSNIRSSKEPTTLVAAPAKPAKQRQDPPGHPQSEMSTNVRRSLTRTNSTASNKGKSSVQAPPRSASVGKAIREDRGSSGGLVADEKQALATSLQSRIDQISSKVVQMFSTSRHPTPSRTAKDDDAPAPPPTVPSLPLSKTLGHNRKESASGAGTVVSARHKAPPTSARPTSMGKAVKAGAAAGLSHSTTMNSARSQHKTTVTAGQRPSSSSRPTSLKRNPSMEPTTTTVGGRHSTSLAALQQRATATGVRLSKPR